MIRLSPPSRTESKSSSSLLTHIVTGGLKYGVPFGIEVAVFYGVLVAAEIIAGSGLGADNVVLLGLVLVLLAMGAAEAHYKLYKRVWAIAGMGDVLALGLAIVEASLLVALANAALPVTWRPFRTLVPLLSVPSVLAAVGFIRLLPRLLSRASIGENRLLVVVGDKSGYSTVKSVVQSSNSLWSAVAIVTGTPFDIGNTVMGIPVVGEAHDLAHWVKATNADGVAFVVQPSGSYDVRELYSICIGLEKPIFILPGAEEWFRTAGLTHLRQLTADDLVGRMPQEFDLKVAEDAIKGQAVLVTGAAGSIGSELSRILASLGPRRLVLLDNNESGLFDIAEDLRVTSSVQIRETLVSVTDRDAVLALFADERPDIVFHVAAYKHVPLLERHPEQAIMVNVIGTLNTLRAAEMAGTRDFILISTDKAAMRHSVMGCTKRLCELMVLGRQGPMRGWAVRFGNVVGSRGSVIPTFERQIQMGGPVTITHPEVSRYMMTIREAATLVISTIRLARSGHLYMLDMGEPIKILDLANALIRARGLRPGKDLKIVFTGLRPGETMTEELLAPEEGSRPTSHPSIHEVVTPMAIKGDDLDWIVERLVELAHDQRPDELARVLRQAVRAPAATTVEEPAVSREQPLATEAEPTL